MTLVILTCPQLSFLVPHWSPQHHHPYVDFLRSQLRAMGSCACGRYPGIEINYREGIVETSPEYVTECLDEIMGCGYDGAVLSWNIMEAPQAHIACLSRQ